MPALLKEIKKWLEDAKSKGSGFLIVMCDTFDNDDYPIFIEKGEDIKEEVKKLHRKDMQRAVEIYDMDKDLDSQIEEHRAGEKLIEEIDDEMNQKFLKNKSKTFESER